MNYKNIKVEKRENYAIIEIANNKNNSLDQKTLNEIGDATKNLNKSKEIKCIGLIGGPKFFSPGADIKELEKLDSKKATNSYPVEVFIVISSPWPSKLEIKFLQTWAAHLRLS